MPTMTERFNSPRVTTGNSPSAERYYRLIGTDDEPTARAYAAGQIPAYYDGWLVLQSISLEPEWVDTSTTDGEWNVTAHYGLQAEYVADDSTYSFDTSGGTQHVTQSIDTIASYAAPGETAPDFKGAIGVTHDSVEGVDVTVPVFAFSETHYKNNSFVTQAYKDTLFSLTGRVNNATFKGRAAGEVLFLGASGTRRGTDGLWEITYRFAGSENQTGLTVGSITGVAKKGWEYLWVRYADTEDDVAGAVVKRPVAVYIEQVYKSGDFSLLGI